MNEERQAAAKVRALAALQAGASVDQAAEAAYVLRGTLWRWRRADAGFDTGWDEATEVGTVAIEDNMVRYATGDLSRPGAATAAIFLLKEPPTRGLRRPPANRDGHPGAPRPRCRDGRADHRVARRQPRQAGRGSGLTRGDAGARLVGRPPRA